MGYFGHHFLSNKFFLVTIEHNFSKCSHSDIIFMLISHEPSFFVSVDIGTVLFDINLLEGQDIIQDILIFFLLFLILSFLLFNLIILLILIRLFLLFDVWAYYLIILFILFLKINAFVRLIDVKYLLLLIFFLRMLQLILDWNLRSYLMRQWMMLFIWLNLINWWMGAGYINLWMSVVFVGVHYKLLYLEGKYRII